MTDYKVEQQKYREAYKRSQRVRVVVCLYCDKGGEIAPLLRIDSEKYAHARCK